VEHFPKAEVPELLNLVYAALRPGGQVSVPGAQCRRVLSSPLVYGFHS
jgi:predicted SAM-dependent methyltransferase